VDVALSVGRPGLYLNNDMHDSMKMGIMAARHILEGFRHDQKITIRRWYEQISIYKET
jgi:hypothetical protein